jgi:hypothetical protein
MEVPMRLFVSCLLLALVAALLIRISTSTRANAETPAQETICDPLIDATPGLYGLCVAFCEAQDCAEAIFVSGQCEPPNPVLLDNYDKKKKPEDPEMPCLPMATPCPCFTADDLRALEVTRCYDNYRVTARVTVIGGGDTACRVGALGGDQALLSAGVDFGVCRLLNFSDSCDIIDFIQTHDLFEDEANACRDLILDEAAARGVVCFSN